MPTVSRPDGAEIAWESAGEGTPVLLLMGLAYPMAMWHRQVPALTAQHRVITVDNRGAGLTGDVPLPYSVEAMASDALAVLDAAGESSAHVVGLSLGGLLAQQIVLDHPERVRSLVLMATHPGIPNAVMDPAVLALVTSGRTTMTPAEAAAASVPFNYADTTSRHLIEEDWDVRLPLAVSPEGYAGQVTGTVEWTRYAELGRVDVPTLVVHGAEDRLLPPANGQRLAEAIPDARLVVVDGANHILTTDRADEVNALLLSWFAEHEDAAT